MKLRCILFVLLFLFVISGCAAQDNQDMLSLSVSVNKLTTAAQGYEFYKNPPFNMAEQEFLTEATQVDPGLLDPFKEYKVKVKRLNGDVAILVCTKDGKQALLQDVGCTNKFDRHLWNASTPVPCVFLKDTFTACEASKE